MLGHGANAAATHAKLTRLMLPRHVPVSGTGLCLSNDDNVKGSRRIHSAQASWHRERGLLADVEAL